MITRLDNLQGRDIYENTALAKLNEVIDAVNELQKQIDKVSCAILDLATPDGENKALKSIQVEPPTDPYAEQRKWIGKLCWFWTFKRVNAIIGVLTDFEIDEPHFRMDGLGWYEHCEPVKPDDDIIYKGGDNVSK